MSLTNGKFLREFSCLVSWEIYSFPFAISTKDTLKIRSVWFGRDFICSVVSSFWDAAAQTTSCCCCMPVWASVAHDCTFHGWSYENRPNSIGTTVFKLSYHTDKSIALLQASMESSPHAILLGCKFWSDDSSANNACTDAPVYFTSQICTPLNGPAYQAIIHN